MSSQSEIAKFEPDSQVELCIQTLGGFRIWRDNVELAPASWGREKALHLFQFFIARRHQASFMHKEQIIDGLWLETDLEKGDRDFKVALHAIHKVLEPDRQPRAEPRFILRHDQTYALNLDLIWIDVDAFEDLIAAGNQALKEDTESAIRYYERAIDLYKGDFLPERRYEDWSSAERERLQLLVLGLMTQLADLLVSRNPLESIRLTQRVLSVDPVWEAAYRTQMQAYLAQGNRPLALRTYQQCIEVLEQEFGLEPLPETQQVYAQIKNQGST